MNNKEIFMDKVASRVKNSVDIHNINAVRQSIFHNWAKEESNRHCFLMLGIEDYDWHFHYKHSGILASQTVALP